LARNWYNETGKRLGEIDIVAQTKEKEIVFVEVKTRVADHDHIDILPEEQITRAKMMKLQRVAECFIKEREMWNGSWRFDAVSVLVSNEKVRDVKHLENIFF
jgi:Holliday junction resolvase-like predicted endonuclease